MLARIIDLLSFHIALPLLWYLLLWIFVSAGIIWVGFIYRGQGKELKQTQEALDEAYEALEVEDDELNHDYATMALMIEEHHQLLLDLQMHADSQDQRMDRLEQQPLMFQLTLAQAPWSQECAENDEDSDEPHSPQPLTPEPLPEWIDGIGGLESL